MVGAMKITFFKNAFARTAEQKDLTTEELKDLILSTTAGKKESLPWLKMATFGTKKTKRGTLRHDDNVEGITGIELDYDDQKYSFDKALERLRSLNLYALIYTSPSHQPEKPKWRVLLPTSELLPPAKRANLAQAVNAAFGGIFAPESFALSQSYFYGSVSANPNHRAEIVPGEYVDLHKNLDNKNPFTSDVFSFRQPLDAAERLANMRHKGEGDAGVHTTQLSVSASLMNAGMSEDDVVAVILEATKKIGGETWDWDHEEEMLHGMCRDWAKKHPSQAAMPAPAEVIDLNSRRAPPNKARLHIYVGEKILERLLRLSGQLIFTNEQLWRFRDGLWIPYAMGEANAWINSEAERELNLLRVPSTAKLCSEVRQWIYRSSSVYREEVKWDAHGKIPTRSGLVDMKTKEVSPLVAEHYATWIIDCEYDPDAKCPWWECLMADCFQGRDPQLIEILQELLGVALLEDKPRSLMRALVLVGPSDSGKSTILNTMAGLLSAEANATTFDTLENTHGLANFLRRVPWVLHEAFDQSKWHFSATVKALLSGDPVNVNVKFGPMVSLRYKNPVFWGTNAPPQFKEATKAIINRMIIIECKRVFTEMVGASLEAWNKGYSSAAEYILATEKPGLLNWAIQGMDRATARGKLAATEETAATLHQVRMESNLVSGFIDECVTFDETSQVCTPDFCAAYSMWFLQNEGEDRRMPSNKSIGRAMLALADPRISFYVGNSKRYYRGIALNSVGLDYWRGVSMSNVANHKSAGMSDNARDVNRRFFLE